MKIIHITADVSAASGVGTFVRRINDELNKLGIDSSIVTDISALERRGLESAPYQRRGLESAPYQRCGIESAPYQRRGLESAPYQRRGTESAPYQLIVHIHGIWLGLHHAAAKWAKAHGAKLVWSTHGMTAPWAMHHKWWKKCLAWGLFQKRDLKSADLVHSTSEQEVKWNECFGLKKQCLVPLGTDLPESEFNAGRLRRHAELRSTCVSTPLASLGRHDCIERSCPVPEVKTLLFVGRVYPVKALDRLIKAFALAVAGERRGLESAPYRWRLRIVGPDEGGHLDELKSLARALGERRGMEPAPYQRRGMEPAPYQRRGMEPAPYQRRGLEPAPYQRRGLESAPYQRRGLESAPYRVEFVGPKYGAELEAEYENCDALALVSHTENFGATVVDAMAHGKPVITSTHTPWSIVRGGNFDHSTLNLQPQPDASGWWVENEPEVLAKAIEELMAMSDEARAAMGAKGRRLVEAQFTWSAVGKRMLKAYQGLKG